MKISPRLRVVAQAILVVVVLFVLMGVCFSGAIALRDAEVANAAAEKAKFEELSRKDIPLPLAPHKTTAKVRRYSTQSTLELAADITVYVPAGSVVKDIDWNPKPADVATTREFTVVFTDSTGATIPWPYPSYSRNVTFSETVWDTKQGYQIVKVTGVSVKVEDE